MTATADQPTPQLPLPRWWSYYALAVSLIAVIGLVLGVIGIYVNNRQDAVAAAENKVRDEQNRALLDCFDDFASDLAGGLPPVREASATRDDALADALDALQTGLVKVQQGGVKPGELAAIISDFATYQQAADNLTQVREDNPYPPPPSAFCSTR